MDKNEIESEAGITVEKKMVIVKQHQPLKLSVKHYSPKDVLNAEGKKTGEKNPATFVIDYDIDLSDWDLDNFVEIRLTPAINALIKFETSQGFEYVAKWDISK